MSKKNEDDCHPYGYPIKLMEELPNTNFYIALSYNESKETIINISWVIYCQLNVVTPRTKTVILYMVEPFAQEQDDLGRLRSMMRSFFQFIKTKPEEWGPELPICGIQDTYVISLQTYCNVTNVR